MLQTELAKVFYTNLLTLLPDGAGQVASCVINSAAAWSQLKLLDWGNPFAWQCPISNADGVSLANLKRPDGVRADNICAGGYI